MTDHSWGVRAPTRHVAEGPAGGFAPTRSASPDAILAGRSRQWLGAVPAAGMWAAGRSLPCGGSVVLTGEAAKCRRSLTGNGRRSLLGRQLVARRWLVTFSALNYGCRGADARAPVGAVLLLHVMHRSYRPGSPVGTWLSCKPGNAHAPPMRQVGTGASGLRPARRPHTVALIVAQGQWRDRAVRAGVSCAQKDHRAL
jgi:hypothetical protein